MKSWKLRRDVLELGRGESPEISGFGEREGEYGGSSECVGGVMTSWPKVSERRKVISGGGGDVGVGVAYCGVGSVISSRLWRRFRREGIAILVMLVVLN